MNVRSIWKKPMASIVLGFAMMFIAGSCGEEGDAVPVVGQLTISFSAVQTPGANGRAASETRPETVILTVIDENGNGQYYVRLPLIAFGDAFISENLELAIGHYRLADFFVMDDQNNVIYSTPRENSPLAEFVEDPLDIEFDIREDENTQIIPQVIAIEDAAKPGDFGYGSFTFNIVKITGLLLPETDEEIEKVSYVFSDRHMFTTYEGEQKPNNGFVDLNMPQLLNGIWKTYITVWTKPRDCSTDYSYSPYQKAYRFTTELTFTGAAFQLPEFSSNRWEPYYYRQNERGIGFFFSANPLKSYNVEIQVPDGLEANYCWLDRMYWNASGGQTCYLDGENGYAHLDMENMSVGRFIMKDQPLCETSDLHIVDSFVAVNSSEGAFHEFFSWTIVDGVAVPTCDSSPSTGRMKSAADRVPPAPRRN